MLCHHDVNGKAEGMNNSYHDKDSHGQPERGIHLQASSRSSGCKAGLIECGTE